MKKIIALAAVAVFALASCKKDYTCECSTTVLGMTSSASTTINDTKKNAEEACEKGTQSANGATVTCKIK